MKTVEQIQNMSQLELNEYMQTLTAEEQNEVKAELFLAAARHFRKPGHSYENCKLKMSRQQYEKLDAYFLMHAP